MIGPVAYGALFVLVLPAGLILWALQLDRLLDLPAYGSPTLGLPVAAAGLGLSLAAMRDLWVSGRGLPMSPFAPKRLVTSGTYRILAHPIYVGAVITTVGVALAARSPGGLWIVSPAVALAAAAFTVGYERQATRARYGALPNPVLHLPRGTDERPTSSDRVSVYALVLLPWLACYQAVEYLGVPSDVRSAYFAWERSIPVWPWTEAVYLATYPLVVLAPLVARSRATLRRFAIDALWATALIIPVYLILPLVASAKPVPGTGVWQTIMSWERAGDAAVTAFPAFHVVWAFLAARLYAETWPRVAILWWGLAAATAASCITTGMHAVIDVAAGLGAYWIVVHGPKLRRRVYAVAEGVANSWREVTLGPVRLLNHGIYAGIGAVLGLIVATSLVGAGGIWWLLAMLGASVVGAALCAQLVEGSPQLLRPYGYFGSVVGASLTAWVAGWFGEDGWLLFAACAPAGAFSQAVGRLRCLVQGCCHGREAPAHLGIRHRHPRSRVVRLSSLGGVPLHPTAVYSLAWTALVGLILLRLWSLHAPLSFIVGCYFILIGIGRFVEEHFRGEVQTPVWNALRLYQWFAIALVVIGATLTALPTPSAPAPGGMLPETLPIIIGAGLVSYLAYGVDFPRGRRRLTRLV